MTKERKLKGCHKMSTILQAEPQGCLRIKPAFRDSEGAWYYEVKGVFDDGFEFPHESDPIEQASFEKLYGMWCVFDALTQEAMRITLNATHKPELRKKFDRIALMKLVDFCWSVVGRKK